MCCCSPSPPKVSSWSSSSSCLLSSVFFHPPFCLFLASSGLFFLALLLFTSSRFRFFFFICTLSELFHSSHPPPVMFSLFSPTIAVICFQDRRSQRQVHVLCVAVQYQRYRALVASVLFPVIAVCCNMYCRISRSGCLTMWFLPSSLPHFKISLPLCSVVTTRPSLLKTSALIFFFFSTGQAVESWHPLVVMLRHQKKLQSKISVTC